MPKDGADVLFDGFKGVVRTKIGDDGCSVFDVVQAASMVLVTALAEIEDAEARIRMREVAFEIIRDISNPVRS